LTLMVVTPMATSLPYICQLRNLVDVAYIVSGILAIRSMPTPLYFGHGKYFTAIFAALTWTKCLYSLRGEAWFGPRFLPIIRAVADTSVFFFILSVAIVAVTHAYYIFGAREDPSPLYASFMPIVRLGIFGDFDLFELEGLDTVFEPSEEGQLEPLDPSPGKDYAAIHATFYVTGLVITILLMNLLVGVLGANYELYEDQSRQLFHRERARMLLDLEKLPWSRCCQRRRGEEGLYIWFLAREEPAADDLRSIRSTVRSIVVDETKQLHKKMERLQEDINKVLEQVSNKKNGGLEK